jgi:hypothetical protein
MRRLLPLLFLSACAVPHTRTVLVEPGVASVQEAIVEVVNATGRDLPAPHPGFVDEIARVASGGTHASFSTGQAFREAAATELHKRGVSVVTGRTSELAVFRITLRDFEIRDPDAAGAVAFVSARYVLLDARQKSLWEVAETRLPIRLGGPDLTRSEIARIATEAVNAALSSFPDSARPH